MPPPIISRSTPTTITMRFRLRPVRPDESAPNASPTIAIGTTNQ